MARDCPFLEWNSSAGFFGGYRCAVTKDSILTGSSIYENFCHNWEKGYSRCPHMKGDENSSSCFITSACVKAKGLPDDCYELTTLRSFRDTWLREQPGGKEVINSYYEIAPAIVARIDKMSNSLSLYERLYNEYILPCVHYIENGNNQAAFDKYTKMLNSLREEQI